MTTIKELLGQGDIQKPKRNFIQENVRKLKEMKLEKTNKLNSQRNKHLQPLTERRKALTTAGTSRGPQPPSPVSRRPAPHRLSVRKSTVSEESPPSPSGSNSPKGYRSQGCQTLTARQLESLDQEGVIRYPSARLQGAEEAEPVRAVSVRNMALQTDSQLEVIHPPPDHTRLPWDSEADNRLDTGSKDFIKMNATAAEPHRHKDVDHLNSLLRTADPTRAPPTYQRGVVPRYLKEHKKELERERISKAKEAGDECPKGHILLPDEVRLKHLTTLRQNYEKLVSQLNQLPISTDTLRTRTRKKEIEADLDRIENAISLFNREKVFVKADS